MKTRIRRFKLVYKIILTLFCINIVPLLVVNLILSSSVDALLQETLERSLREGRDYMRSVFGNGMRGASSATRSLSEDKRLVPVAQQILTGHRRLSKNFKERLTRLMSEYNAPLLMVYRVRALKRGRPSVAMIFRQRFSYFPDGLVQTPREFILRGIKGSSAMVSITKQGLIFASVTPLKVDERRQVLYSSARGRVSYVLVTGRIRDLAFLNQLRVALRKDFTLVGWKRKALLSTRFNEWGESLRDKRVQLAAVERGFASGKGSFFSETHLNKPQVSLAFPIKEADTGRIVTIGLVSRERSYSREQERIFLFLQLITLVSVGLTVFVSILLSRNIVGPVNALIKGINRLNVSIGKDEEYRPIIIKTRDEILTLAKAYNKMAGELFTSHRELKEYSENLEEMVKERTAELHKANLRMKRDLDIARTVQFAILPRTMPVTEDYAIAAWMTPMLETSGDYYDIIEVDEETTGMLVVDVSGHGIPSALITMMAKTSFSNFAKRPELSTGEICRLVNTIIHNALGDIGFYLTAFFVKVNVRTMVMEYTNAGHHKAIRYNKRTDTLEELDADGFFIGSVEDVVYETKSVRLEKDDRVLIFTDGIVEARDDSGEFFEEKRLFAFIRRHRDLDARGFVHGLMAEVTAFYKEASPNDDRTVMVFDVFSSPDRPLDIARSDEDKEGVRRTCQQALESIASGEYKKAEELFQRAISYEPDNYIAWFNLGIVQYRLSRLEKALNSWERTVEIRPEFVKARENLAALRKIMQQEPSS